MLTDIGQVIRHVLFYPDLPLPSLKMPLLPGSVRQIRTNADA
jgi:hypothetical protein